MLSVIIIAKNEEKNIARCVKSVLWADEIIVVDAESTDNTQKIAKEIGARVIVRKWEGYAIQKEFALLQASCSWALSLDADEEASHELKKEIQQIITSNNSYDGYEIPRKSFFLGKWIRYGGWYPGYQLRLFKKSKTHMNHRPVHEGFSVEGAIGKLKGNIIHYTYRSLRHYLEKMNEYSSLDVMNKFSANKKIRWYNFTLNPFSAFIRMYVSLRGFKDGFHGFLLACYSALHVLVIYAKTWEYQTSGKYRTTLPPVTSGEIAELQRLSA